MDERADDGVLGFSRAAVLKILRELDDLERRLPKLIRRINDGGDQLNLALEARALRETVQAKVKELRAIASVTPIDAFRKFVAEWRGEHPHEVAKLLDWLGLPQEHDDDPNTEAGSR